MKKRITLYEVGPRDGLQNEATTIPTNIKIDFINHLSESGLPKIETTSFVSPKWVPQLADAKAVMEGIQRNPRVKYTVLVPNTQGLQAALACKPDEIAVFTAASETFSQKNTNCSIEESFKRITDIAHHCHTQSIPFRGYISCVLGCPYEGEIDIQTVVLIAKRLIKLGCYQVSLGDTIGIGTPEKTRALLKAVSEAIGVDKVAVHFHDTHQHALANIEASLEMGITTIDSSVSGLGGCPYAPGASGNVSTEAVVTLLNHLGYETNIDLEKLRAAGKRITQFLKQNPQKP